MILGDSHDQLEEGEIPDSVSGSEIEFPSRSASAVRNKESPNVRRLQEKRQLSEPSLPPAKRKRYDAVDMDLEVKEEQPTSWFNYESSNTMGPGPSDDLDEELDSESSSWSDSFIYSSLRTLKVQDQEEEVQDPRDLSPEPFRVPSRSKPPTTPSKKREKTSKYVGVHWSSTYKKWKAKRTIQGRCINLGVFDDEKIAAEASDACIRKHGVKDAKLNFPDEIIMFVEKIKKIDGDRCLVQWANCDDSQDTWEPTSNLLETQAYKEFTGQVVRNTASSKMQHSKYIGVSWSVRDGKWTVARSIKSKKMYGGTFSDEISAAKASDDLVRKYHDDSSQSFGMRPRLNFPNKRDSSNSIAKPSSPNTDFPHLPKQRGSSKFVGVQWDKRRGMWKVERKIDGKTVLGGHFEDEKEAAHEADEIVRRSKKSEYGHNHVINFPKESKLTQPPTSEKSNGGEGSMPLCGSHYVGVSWMNGLKKWRVERRLGGKSILGGKFDTELEAAKKSDEILRQYLTESNRTETQATFNFAVPSGIEAPSLMNLKKKKASTQNVEKINGIPQSKYIGVSWCKEQMWLARRRINGVNISGGTFTDPKEAARRSDELVRDAEYPKGCKLNFPFDAGIHTDLETSSLAEKQKPKAKPTIESAEVRQKSGDVRQKPVGACQQSSKHTGVGWNKQSSKWQSWVLHKGKHIHVGLFENEEEARYARQAKQNEWNNENKSTALSSESKKAEVVVPKKQTDRKPVVPKKLVPKRNSRQRFIPSPPIPPSNLKSIFQPEKRRSRRLQQMPPPLSPMPPKPRPSPASLQKRQKAVRDQSSKRRELPPSRHVGIGIVSRPYIYYRAIYACNGKQRWVCQGLDYNKVLRQLREDVRLEKKRGSIVSDRVGKLKAKANESPTGVNSGEDEVSKRSYTAMEIDGSKFWECPSEDDNESSDAADEKNESSGAAGERSESSHAADERSQSFEDGKSEISERAAPKKRQKPLAVLSNDGVKGSSKYVGVSWNKREQRWKARITVNKIVFNGGSHKSEIGAAQAVNALCRQRGIPLKNPSIESRASIGELRDDESDSVSVEEMTDEESYSLSEEESAAETEPNASKKSEKKSKFKGVKWMARKGQYRVEKIINSEMVNGGYFYSELEAAHAADDLLIKFREDWLSRGQGNRDRCLNFQQNYGAFTSGQKQSIYSGKMKGKNAIRLWTNRVRIPRDI